MGAWASTICLRQGIRLHQIVGEQDREGFVSNQIPGAPDRMPQAQGFLLTRITNLARRREQIGDQSELGGFAAAGEGILKFLTAVEMILDRGFSTSRHEDELLDTGCARFFDSVLNQRLIDHRKHFFGHGFGRG